MDCNEQEHLSCGNKHEAVAIFSGKQGRPTWTKLLTCSPYGDIYFLSASYQGSNNDPMVYMKRENQIHQFLSKKEAVGGDAAFAFINEHHPTLTTTLGNTEKDKDFNKRFVPIWLVVENVCGVLEQRWPILKNTFRHNKACHNGVWSVLVSLHNCDVQAGRLVLRGNDFWERWHTNS